MCEKPEGKPGPVSNVLSELLTLLKYSYQGVLRGILEFSESNSARRGQKLWGQKLLKRCD